MITGRVDGAEAAAVWLRARHPLAMVAIEAATQEQIDALAERVLDLLPPSARKHERLGVRISVSGDRVSAALWLKGRYLQAWDQGVDMEVTVHAHLRRITKAFGRPINPITIQIRAYQRHMRLAGHFVLDRARAGMEGEYAGRLAHAVTDAMGG